MNYKDIVSIYEPRPLELSKHPLTIWVWDETNNVNYFDGLPKKLQDSEIVKLVAMGDNHIQLTIKPVKEDEQLSFNDILHDILLGRD